MDEIINDFHDLDQIPVFQTQIDPEMMNTADRLDVLQMNIGRVCNLACKHCHVCAGPNRTEVMSREVMADCIQFAREQQVQTIDCLLYTSKQQKTQKKRQKMLRL